MRNLRVKLEEKIQEKHILGHSFYTRWQTGKLTKEELQGYAKEYYPFEKEFPRFLSSMHARCEDATIRKGLLENLVHEEQGPDNHPELWLRFAEGVGVSREDVNGHFHSDETEHLLRVMRKHASSENIADGVAALYAYEKQQPDVARQKIEGLKCFYNVTEERTLQFFKAHGHYDVLHAENEAGILETLCQDEKAEDRAVQVVGEVLEALYEFLDGVEKRYKPAHAEGC